MNKKIIFLVIGMFLISSMIVYSDDLIQGQSIFSWIKNSFSKPSSKIVEEKQPTKQATINYKCNNLIKVSHPNTNYYFSARSLIVNNIDECANIRGNSMYPMVGDKICYEFYSNYKKSEVLKEGMIIVFKKEGNLWSHRIISINKNVIITKGDNNFDSETINEKEIYGVVRLEIQ